MLNNGRPNSHIKFFNYVESMISFTLCVGLRERNSPFLTSCSRQNPYLVRFCLKKKKKKEKGLKQRKVFPTRIKNGQRIPVHSLHDIQPHGERMKILVRPYASYKPALGRS